jgi:hypothetical protein
MSIRVRRVGFGAALATGLSMIAVSVGGIASLDADLQAAAEQRPGGERTKIVDVRDCPRDGDRRRIEREI